MEQQVKGGFREYINSAGIYCAIVTLSALLTLAVAVFLHSALSDKNKINDAKVHLPANVFWLESGSKESHQEGTMSATVNENGRAVFVASTDLVAQEISAICLELSGLVGLSHLTLGWLSQDLTLNVSAIRPSSSSMTCVQTSELENWAGRLKQVAVVVTNHPIGKTIEFSGLRALGYDTLEFFKVAAFNIARPVRWNHSTINGAERTPYAMPWSGMVVTAVFLIFAITIHRLAKGLGLLSSKNDHFLIYLLVTWLFFDFFWHKELTSQSEMLQASNFEEAYHGNFGTALDLDSYQFSEAVKGIGPRSLLKNSALLSLSSYGPELFRLRYHLLPNFSVNNIARLNKGRFSQAVDTADFLFVAVKGATTEEYVAGSIFEEQGIKNWRNQIELLYARDERALFRVTQGTEQNLRQ